MHLDEELDHCIPSSPASLASRVASTCWSTTPSRVTGRVIAAFIASANTLSRSGDALVIDDLAEELGINEPAKT
jgi:hypothetical protein